MFSACLWLSKTVFEWRVVILYISFPLRLVVNAAIRFYQLQRKGCEILALQKLRSINCPTHLFNCKGRAKWQNKELYIISNSQFRFLCIFRLVLYIALVHRSLITKLEFESAFPQRCEEFGSRLLTKVSLCYYFKLHHMTFTDFWNVQHRNNSYLIS